MRTWLAVSVVVFLWGHVRFATSEEVKTISFIAAPRAVVVERNGITGGGAPLMIGDRALLFYPNHPDDFGGSTGTATSLSTDGGRTWSRLQDDWPLPKMVDVWGDRLSTNEWIAFGLRWVPDTKQRYELGPKDVPADAYRIATSRDEGRTWTSETAGVEYVAELGVVARPLPHILPLPNGDLLMPAYAWSKTGNAALLLKSVDRGRRWTVLATVCTVPAIVKSGVPVSTPWLETTISTTRDGGLLAVIRTGSNENAVLVGVRSTDGGRTWSNPEPIHAGATKRPVAGKLPSLCLLPNGVLVLLTAHTKNHCRLLASDDGTGRSWSEAHIVTSVSGGNAGLCAAGNDSVLITTPMNGRIHAWKVALRRGDAVASRHLPAPSEITLIDGVLAWQAVPNAVTYRVTPVLTKPAMREPPIQTYPYVSIQTLNAEPRLDVSRQLLVGSGYRFEVAAVDREGKVSRSTSSDEITIAK